MSDPNEIERYLLGKMDAEEQAGFETRISLDPELKKEVDRERILILAIQEGRKEELRDYIKQNTQTERSTVPIPLLRTRGARAVLILAALGGIGFWLYNNTYIKDSFRYSGQLSSAGKNVPLADSSLETKKDTLPHQDQATNDSTQKAQSDTTKLALNDHDKVLDSKDSNGIAYNEDLYKSGPERENAQGSGREATPVMDSIKHDVLLGDTSMDILTINSIATGYKALSNKNNAGPAQEQRQNSEHLRTEEKIKPIISAPAAAAAETKSPEKTDEKIQSPVNIEYWESPIHFTGYRFFRNVLQLYGINVNEKAQLIDLDGNYYLKTVKGVYGIKEQNDFNPFIPVKNREILDKLR